MNKINSAAAQARENARHKDGKFGCQEREQAVNTLTDIQPLTNNPEKLYTYLDDNIDTINWYFDKNNKTGEYSPDTEIVLIDGTILCPDDTPLGKNIDNYLKQQATECGHFYDNEYSLFTKKTWNPIAGDWI